jgi:multiple sugar transport system ATP-binding protein
VIAGKCCEISKALRERSSAIRFPACQHLIGGNANGVTDEVPPTHTARYRPSVGKDLIFGLRPEHITEPRREGRDPRCEFTMTVDVIEPMGMETMVFFTVNGTEVCARVEPSAATAPGQPMRLYANLNHMHLIDPVTELVL